MQETRRNRHPEKPPKKRTRPLVLALYGAFWLAVLVMFSVLFVGQMESYNELQAALTAVNADVARATAETARLEEQLTFFETDAYLEELARRRGMVRPNEIIFRNIAD